MSPDELQSWVRDVPDFPKPGIVFKDITPLLAEPRAFAAAIERMADGIRVFKPDILLGIEARGFMFAGALAYHLGTAFAPVRKPGKLPWRAVRETYDLEYGSDALELHEDALVRGQRAVIVDDVLATGGTAAAVTRLAGRIGADVVGLSFLIELGVLKGRDRLAGKRIDVVLRY